MSLLQIKKPTFHIILAFLIIVLLSSNIHVQAENTDKRRKAEALWEQGKDDFSILSTTYFTISNKDQMSARAKGYQKTLEKFNNSLSLYRELGDQQSEADLLTWMAAVKIEMGIGHYVDALNYMKESLEIYGKLNSRPGESAFVKDVDKAMKTMALFVMGKNHQNAGDYKSALKKYKTALQLVKKIGKRYVGGLSWEIGVVQYELGNYSDAEHYYQKALTLFRKLGKKDYEGRMLFNMGRLYLAKYENSKSLEYFDKALKIFEQFNDKNGIMAVQFYKGRIYYDQNDKSKSLVSFKKALEASQDIANQEATAELAEEIGSVYMGMGYLNIPVEHYKQALNIIHEIGNSPKEGDILYTIGQLYSGMGDYKSAQEALNKAMQIYKKHNMIIDQGETLVEIGKVNSNLGNYLEAIDNLQKALKVFEGASDSDAGKKVALNTLEEVYRLLGDAETAIEYVLKSNDIKKPDIKNKWEQLSLLGTQGIDFIKENKIDKTLDTISEILALSKETDDKVFKGFCFSEIGLIYLGTKKFSKALGFYNQALEVSRKNNYKAGELKELFNIARTYDYPCLSDYENALEYYEQALVIAKEIGDKPSQEKCLASMGKAYSRQKKDKNAVEYYEQALIISKEMSMPEKIWSNQHNLGVTAFNSRQSQEAKRYLSEAINTIESIREKIPVEEYKISFVENKLSVYSDMIMVLLELEEDEEAFNYVERAKSRTLLDILGNKAKLEKGKDKELSQEEMKLRKKINKLLEKMRTEQSQPKEKQRKVLKKRKKELKLARKEYAKHLLEIKQKNHELYSLVSVNPLTLREVQELIEPDTTLLEYYILYGLSGSDFDVVICWVLNKNEYKVIIQNTTGFISKVTTFREKIKNLQSDYKEEAGELYDLLIRQAKPYIKTKRICIIPHSVLHYLPFQALINANGTENKSGGLSHFLIEEYDIFYAPSASVLKFVLEKRKVISGKVLAFGNPELGDKNLGLPYAEDELKRIKESYPGTSIYMNEKATEEKVKSLSGDYDIIHFASHAEFNPKSPLFSCIKMAKEKDEDGRLEVHEIFNLNLEKASLVTLSACETGLSKLTSGDELIGLTRGFIYAGTPSIVASLWNVNDKSTSDLMNLFYKNLKTHSKAEALRMAQLEMINGEVGRGIVRGVGGITTSEESKDKPQSSTTVNGSHPYFWAPFILLGDWK